MNSQTNIKAMRPDFEKTQKGDNQDSAVKILGNRASKELVIGFMGAVGCGLPRVITECEDQLKKMGYEISRIKLSEFIGDQIEKNKAIIPPEERHVKVKYIKYQIGGNSLRKDYGNDILAKCAINQIGRIRLAYQPESKEYSATLNPVAFLIDQIKHPEEVKLLRLVYRRLFYLVGVMSTHDHRMSRLKDEGLTDTETEEVITRDRKESEDHGQQLEKAFKYADYFMHHPLGHETIVPKQVSRFLDLIHGSNSITPTKHEHAMYLAHSTALRSACFSRQVGAAILDKQGRVIAVGTNDVPQYGGGLYGEENGKADKRCHHYGHCENDKQKSDRKKRIHKGVTAVVPELFPEEKIRIAVNAQIDKLVDLVYKESGIPHLIEFSRAVHAEMDALVSLARGGGGSSVGASLYTTTFPCHNCARHIIAAGIYKVYYIEPYEKSLAPEAHEDAIEVLDHDVDNDGLSEKVKFIHFSGVAPKLYADLFIRELGRKDTEGKFIGFSSTGGELPEKIVKEYLDSYRSFEDKIAATFDEVFSITRKASNS